MNESEQPHIEIKGQRVTKGDAQKMIEKGSIIGVVCGGKITPPAKKLLDNANIAYAEVPESEFMESEVEEER